MRVCYLDCFSGVSGNMLLGALLDAGLPEDVLQSTLSGLKLSGWQLDISSPVRSGLRACLVRVETEETTSHRHLDDILTLLDSSSLSQAIIARASGVFTRLAQAEAKVHGTTPEMIHFHEVGAVDAIIDVIGVVAGMEYLGIEECICSPLPMSTGWTTCSHGELPLPAPAVCELLTGVPLYGESLSQELVTPTGAALVAELASSFGPMPPLDLEQVGYGAGTMERQDGRPNLLRLMIGNRRIVEEARQVEVIETHLDDWNPELWPHVSERLMDGGALDVSLVSILMKKGRPGYLLRILADPAHAATLKKLVLQETSSIGLRFHRMERMTLPRESVELNTPWGPVQAKRVETPAGARIIPEFESCRALADKNNIPLQQIYDLVTALGNKQS